MSFLALRLVGMSLVLLGLLVTACDNESPTEPEPEPEPEPVCAFTLSATTFAFEASGGSASIDVSAPAGCAWTAQAEASWLSILSGPAGTGPGTVAFAAAANDTTSDRAGSLRVAGQPVTVTQQAAPSACTYAVAPAEASFGEEGGTGVVSVTAPDTCPWTARSGAPWLAITDGASGTGSGTVQYTVERNSDLEDRETTIEVAEQTVAVRQAGDVTMCEYAVSPVHFTPCMAGPEMTATIETGPVCPWTATPDVSWITMSRETSGKGPAVIGFAASNNFDAPRTGRVLVRWPAPTAGQNLQVRQAGCFYAVTVSSIGFTAAGGTGSFGVLQQSDPIECGGPLQNACVWTAAADVPWISITSSMPRAGDDTVAFTVAPNTDGVFRAGTVTVRDKAVQITQAGQ